MTGPEPGDLAEIEWYSRLDGQVTRLALFTEAGQWTTRDGDRISTERILRVRPLSVVPTDSLEARIAETLLQHHRLYPGGWVCACGWEAFVGQSFSAHVAAAVRSAITKPTTED